MDQALLSATHSNKQSYCCDTVQVLQMSGADMQDSFASMHLKLALKERKLQPMYVCMGACGCISSLQDLVLAGCPSGCALCILHAVALGP